MGKIFDALEKSQKEINKTAAAAPSSGKNAEAEAKKGDTAVELFEYSRKTAKLPLDRNLLAFHDPHSFESEQFKMIRTNLLFPISGRKPRSLMITSVGPGEGKSFVASNLAISFAQNINEHVLLIDCDMRNPTIHRHFGFGRAEGLSEYLADGSPLGSFIRKTRVQKLSILPGGKPPFNPAELLSSDRMSKLLDEVKSRYDDRYIIIDSPPPTLTAETHAIARQVEGILIVVKYGATRRELVQELTEDLGRDKVLGVVFNWFDADSMKYYGFGKYRKYKQYYGQPRS